MAECVELARRLGERVGRELGIPVYLYEQAATSPERRNLADIRVGEYEGLAGEARRSGLEARFRAGDLRAARRRFGHRRALVPGRLQRQPEHGGQAAGDPDRLRHPREGQEAPRRRRPAGERRRRRRDLGSGPPRRHQGGRLDDPRVRLRADLDQRHRPRRDAAACRLRHLRRARAGARIAGHRLGARRAGAARGAPRRRPALPRADGALDRRAGERADPCRGAHARTLRGQAVRPAGGDHRSTARCAGGSGSARRHDARRLRRRALVRLAGTGRRFGRGLCRSARRRTGDDGGESLAPQEGFRGEAAGARAHRGARPGAQGSPARRGRRRYRRVRPLPRGDADAEGERRGARRCATRRWSSRRSRRSKSRWGRSKPARRSSSSASRSARSASRPRSPTPAPAPRWRGPRPPAPTRTSASICPDSPTGRRPRSSWRAPTPPGRRTCDLAAQAEAKFVDGLRQAAG